MSASDDPTLPPPPSPNPDIDEPTLARNADPTIDLPGPINEEERFGDYELIEEIARGGMGVVYRARQVSLNRTVALKMILTGQLASESDVRRFYQEAESAANLDHSGIVPIYDIGEHDGHHFFSMKFIEGGSLADALPTLRKEDPRKLIQLVADVARAVHHAHQRGILHRDLKPANILLDEDGQPLVTDLGLARQVESDSNITNTGAVVGTPAYMPPEQAAASKEVTTAVDIYSLGAILYEALTGRPPHKADSPMQTLMLVMEGRVTPPREVDSKIHRSLDLVCMKCLATKPEERYSSAAALAEDLENWLEGKSVSVRPPSVGSTLANAVVTNFRSAFGAALTGIAAGLLLSFSLGHGFTSAAFTNNSPTRIYAAMMSEPPSGRQLVRIRESNDGAELAALIAVSGMLFCIAGVGILVTAVTRPKPGAAPLAMGVIAALMVAVTSFAGQLGPLSVGLHIQSSLVPRLETLNEIAVGTPEQEAAARDRLAEEFPVLQEIAPEERANVLAYRMFYDSFFGSPFAIYVAFLGVAFFSLPTIVATTFASKVLAEKGKLRSVIIPYVEFMWFICALAMCLVSFSIWNTGNRVWATNEGPPLAGQAVTLLVLVTVSIVLYKRIVRWKWRLGFYATMVLLGIAALAI